MSLPNLFAAFSLAGLIAGSASLPAWAAEFKTLYNFGQSGGRSEQPDSPLVLQGSTLYGTTAGAFAMAHFTCYGSGYGTGSCGTIFAFDLTSNTLKTLHQFKSDGGLGRFPQSGLVALGSTLYGITLPAVYDNYPATLFSTSPSAQMPKLAARFPVTDGSVAYFPPAALGNVLYGTASDGGSPTSPTQAGSIWSYDPTTGAITDAYYFKGQPDGDYPLDTPLALNGVLYGTTVYGGTSNWGTIFSYNPTTQTETVLYSFPGGKGGQIPAGKLVNIGTVIYGVAEGGPKNFGIVWSLDTATGAFSILHGVNGGTEGSFPSDLLPLNGALIVSTAGGGEKNYGTILSIDPATGKTSLLKTFNGERDGIGPATLDVVSGGTIYGHSAVSSFYPFVYNGTIFSLTP